MPAMQIGVSCTTRPCAVPRWHCGFAAESEDIWPSISPLFCWSRRRTGGGDPPLRRKARIGPAVDIAFMSCMRPRTVSTLMCFTENSTAKCVGSSSQLRTLACDRAVVVVPAVRVARLRSEGYAKGKSEGDSAPNSTAAG
jgi:hypothetical protein